MRPDVNGVEGKEGESKETNKDKDREAYREPWQ